ncbi:MAG: 2-oxo acid dehydrogenase subunit E2 [Chloroflexi bacterium]|nr:2-oxo acid dehydrogenase subunit E2 [Chloroflexota bacterium]
MATEVIMPQMGFDMKEGKVVRWIKKEGDPVQRGEPIAEIETDKAVVEIEAFGSGVLRKALVGEGQAVPVGQVIGIIAASDEPLPEVAARPTPAAAAPTSAPAPVPAAPPAEVRERTAAPASALSPSASSELALSLPKGQALPKGPAPAAPGRETLASPIARKLADEMNVDLRQVAGTGPGGRITKDDVLAYVEKRKATPAAAAVAPSPPAPPAGEQVIELSKMRLAISRRMAESKRTTPHFYVQVAIDMTEAMTLRQGLNEALGGEVKVSVNDMIVKGCAKTLAKFPLFNSSYVDDKIHVHPGINVGIAIALDQGLIAPAIPDTNHKSLVEIAKASKDLVERARQGVLKAEEYTGATFNVTNLGMYDVDNFIAIITPPQSAALSVGAVKPQPVVRNGQVVVREMMSVTLCVDHRVTDGAQGGLFLRELRSVLENPVSLLL